MSPLPFARELPVIVQVAPCSGWYARYKDDGPSEPVAAWAVVEEISEGERIRYAAAMVPDSHGALCLAGEAANFDQLEFRGETSAGIVLPPEKSDEAKRLIGSVMLWLDRSAADPEAYLSKADVAAHRSELMRLASLLGVTVYGEALS